MHSPTTTVRSWPALALAVFFAVVTGWTLLDDVIAGRAAFTVAHLSSIAALVAALGALHYAIPAIRSGAIVAGLLLALSGVTALGYVVIASGMRNDQLVGDKAASAEHVNAERAGVLKMRSEAEYMLAPCPAGAAKADVGNRCGLRAAMTAECASGKGTKCDGKAYSVRTYEAAIDGYNAKLARLGPEVNPRAGYERSAAFLAALPYVTATPEAIAAALERLMPRAPVIVIELAGLAFALFAFGHRRGRPADVRPVACRQPATVRQPRATRAPITTVANDDNLPPRGGNRLPVELPVATRAAAEADVVQLVARGEPLPSQDVLARRWGVHKGTASKWLSDFERRGLVSRTWEGRSKRIAAAG